MIEFERNFKDSTDKFSVSTIEASDRDENQFETAISSTTQGWKVVELYETFKESRIGHYKWFAMVQQESFSLDDHKEVFEDYALDKSKVFVKENGIS